MKKFLQLTFCCLLLSTAHAQFSCNSVRMADVPGPGRLWATACSNNQFALAGGGVLEFSGDQTAEFYLYNIATDTWTQVQDYPAGAHEGMISFEVNGRFFAGLGTPFIQPSAQMFELDLTTLTWIPRASAPGAHYLIDAYVVNGKAYIIPVYVDNNSKIIEYNPELDSWRVVTDFNSLDAQYPIGFALGTNIYFGMGPGALNSGTMRKWFRFDTQTETVVQLNDVPVASSQSCAFKIGNTGYVYNVGQDNKDMYRYNQDSDTWDLMCSFADNRLANASAFGDASFGYIVFGQKSLPGENVSSNELWRFEPLDLTSNNEINNAENNIQLFSDADGAIHINFPLPEVYSISVYDLTGRCISSESIMVSESNFNWINKYTAKGLHFFQIKNSKNEVLLSKKIVLQ